MDAPKHVVKLFLGEQDGAVLSVSKKPNHVMRVPNYHALSVMAEAEQAGMEITADMVDEKDKLPYVLRRMYRNGEDGPLVFEYYYCEEINQYHPEV